jgi:hypothetical protein
MAWPQLRVRCEITNGDGTWDSQSPGPLRGDGLDVPRIKATVIKTLDPVPNTAEIRIFNLSERTIDLITGTVRKTIDFTPAQQAELRAAGASALPFEVIYDNFGLASVRLSWGYQGQDPTSPFPPLSLGFLGGSTNMTRVPGLSSVLLIKAEDGGRLLGAARLDKSYKAGADTVDILADLIGALGLTVDRDKLSSAMLASLLQRQIPATKLTQGRGYNAMTSPAVDQIRSIMSALDLRWSVQDGEFLLLDTNTVLAGYEPLLLDATTGTLLGKPEQLEAQQMRARTPANAEARPGREVHLTARNISAQYRIDRVTHELDAKTGGESVCTLAAIQVVAGVF